MQLAAENSLDDGGEQFRLGRLEAVGRILVVVHFFALALDRHVRFVDERAVGRREVAPFTDAWIFVFKDMDDVVFVIILEIAFVIWSARFFHSRGLANIDLNVLGCVGNAFLRVMRRGLVDRQHGQSDDHGRRQRAEVGGLTAADRP